MNLPRLLNAGLFLLSVSILLLELLHTRLLSFMMLPSMVYVVVTFAMMGFGLSGVALSIFPADRFRRPENLLAVLSLAFGVTAIAGIIILGRFPLSPYDLRHSPEQLALLAIYYVVFTLPYFFAGSAVAATFALCSDKISKLYFINLVGSAIGCVMLVWVITPLGGENTLLLAAALSMAAAFCFAGANKNLKVVSLLGAAACVVGIGIGADQIIRMKIDPQKGLGLILNREDSPGEILYTGWSPISRTDISTATWMDEGEHIQGLFGQPWPHRWLSTDGAAGTPFVSGVPNETIEEWRKDSNILRGWRMLPYQLIEDPSVLIVGVGGGADVVSAKIRGIERIVGVDINPITIHALKNVYNDYNNNLYNEPGIDIHAAEGRSFVIRAEEQFTNIHMNGVDTYNALASGAYVMAENYLYTVEAMVDYLNKLTDDGMLSIVRMSFETPRETIKLCTGLMDAFPLLGLESPENHIMIFGQPGSPWTTLLCKKTAFTPDQIALYETIVEEQNMLLFYRPGMEIADPLPDDVSRSQHFINLFKAQREGTLDAFIADYPFDITSATDDRPFFFKVHKTEDLIRLRTPEDVHTGNVGVVTLAVLLVQTAVMSIVLIAIPLWYFHREGLNVPGRNRFLLYFAGLGMAFMLVEMAVMQKLSLYLGHPTYSISVVLTTILFFSGIGSYVSGRIKSENGKIIRFAISAIALLVVVYVFLLPPVIEATHSLALPLRMLIAGVLLSPAAFFMGMPFPTGLRAITEVNDRFIPWAWGVNGIASVIGSVGSLFLAMGFGFTAVMLAGAVAYVFAATALGKAAASEPI